MLHNLLKIAIRNLWRQKISSSINIIGLSIGLISSLIIFMFIYKEMNYDGFHKNSRNIYRVYQHVMNNGQLTLAAYTPVPMGPTLLSEYPEVRKVVRLMQIDNFLVVAGQSYFNIQYALYVDPSFFEVFSFRLLHGDKVRVLSEPRSVVLTQSTARKMFGSKDPINEMIQFENDTSYFRVTGICADPPDNSHFTYEMLISMDAFWGCNSTDWMSNYMNTYVLLLEDFPIQQLEGKFPELIKKYMGPQVQKVLGISMDDLSKKGPQLEFRLQPLKDIHLNTSMLQGLKPSSNRKYLYIFCLIGVFTILIAGINFINLSTSRSTLRAREVGIRKVLGSTRNKLIWQFLTESIVISIISLALALILLVMALPAINRVAGLSLDLSIFSSWIWIGMLPAAAILIGILAGIYPAFLLSSFHTSTILKDKTRSGSSGSMLRSILVIFQFFTAIVILSGTVVVYKQLKFMQNKDLGFEKGGIMVIERANSLNNQLGTFVSEIRKYPGITNVTSSTSIPGSPNSDNGFKVEGRSQTGIHVLYCTWVDHSFINTYKLKMADGRDFSEDYGSDSLAVIINEAAARKMELTNPVGTRLMRPDGTGNFTFHTIIGVVEDFHFKSLHNAIEPCILLVKPKTATPSFLSIRFDKGNELQSLLTVEKVWRQLTGDKPFEYTFLDEELNNLYAEEKQTGSLSSFFTLLAIFIACLGLLGLISFTTEQRTKEIGIRKIMGASVWSIVRFLSFKTVKLIIISSFIAWPIAYLYLKNWLIDFAYRIELHPLVFMLASLIVLGLSLLTIGSHVWYAATKNPLDSLRYE